MIKVSKAVYISIILITTCLINAHGQELVNINGHLYNADSTLLKELALDLEKFYLIEPLEKVKKDSITVSLSLNQISKARIISNYISKTKNLISNFPDIPAKLKNELDSLEDQGLSLSAMAIVNSTNATEKIKSLKSLGQYYFEHERVGDSAYLMIVQKHLQKEGYKFPNVVPSMQVGFAQGKNMSIDASIMIVYMKPRNSALKEKYSYSGITLGGEYYNNNISGYKIGAQIYLGRQFSLGLGITPIGSVSYVDSVKNTTVNTFSGIFYRAEIQYGFEFGYFYLGLTAKDVDSHTDVLLRKRINSVYNPVSFGIRLQLPLMNTTHASFTKLQRDKLRTAVYR
jgi:hypothetical protein